MRSGKKRHQLYERVESESGKEKNLTRQINTGQNNNKRKDAMKKAKATSKRNNICGKCGLKGHFKNECQTVQCQNPNCGSGEHTTRNCPKLTDEQKDYFKRKDNRAKSVIEKSGLQSFDMTQHVRDLPCGLTIGQAMALSSKYRDEFYKSVAKHKGNTEINLVNMEKEATYTPTSCTAELEGKKVRTIIDSGAAICSITKRLLDKLQWEIDMPSNIVAVTADGKRHRSLGKVVDIHFQLEGIPTKATLEVIESQNDEYLLLGTNWIRENGVLLDFEDKILRIKNGNRYEEIPIEFTRTFEQEDDEDDYEEYENEDFEFVNL